jgi:hypothetical protein
MICAVRVASLLRGDFVMSLRGECFSRRSSLLVELEIVSGYALAMTWRLMAENFKSYSDIKRWLEANEIGFRIETESWA